MKRVKLSALFLLLAVVSFFLIGCTTPPQKTGDNRLTAGEAKRQIIKGVTTQADIVSYFGSPNLVTTNKDNKEVWAYNRMSFDSFSGEQSGSLSGIGGGASSIFFGGFGGSQAVSSSSSKSFDLVITFDKKDVVEDYKVVQSSY